MKAYDYLSSPKSTADIMTLYDALGWNDYLKLSSEALSKAMDNSWLVVYVYDGASLIGTGRVISDGIINGYICGVCVLEAYRKQGIGKEIIKYLVTICREHHLHVQLLCEEHLETYYNDLAFHTFAIGMKLDEK